MENKGLNVFNDKYVLASPETATDADYAHIEAVIAHEYFHNWTGNRITCRDWFQLCLKEGLTVFRDQEFSSDMRSRPVKRIADVRALRAAQFVEDAGPLAHPVRPETYREINNFYTATVYEKGAELVRMSKIEAGRLRLDFDDIPLDTLLNDAMRVVAARAEDKALQVTARISPQLRIRADRRALKQVALNLLSNAIKFTPTGGRITVRGRATNHFITLSIADTGIGIAQDALARLGRPFEQVESQLTKSHQGSGLGLAISKSLVELHGGRMIVRVVSVIASTRRRTRRVTNSPPARPRTMTIAIDQRPAARTIL